MAADSTSEILHRNIDRKRIIPIRSLIPPSPRSVSPHDSRAAIILVNNRLQQSLHEYFLVFSSIKDIFVRSVSRTRYLSTTFFHPRYIMLLQRFFFIFPPLSLVKDLPPPPSLFLSLCIRAAINNHLLTRELFTPTRDFHESAAVSDDTWWFTNRLGLFNNARG